MGKARSKERYAKALSVEEELKVGAGRRSPDRENAVSDALTHIGVYDQATAGPLTVWQTLDGSIYVINGHHRRELVIRTGVESVPVRIFREADGITFDVARALWRLAEPSRWQGHRDSTRLMCCGISGSTVKRLRAPA
jgi:hypothetical protein